MKYYYNKDGVNYGPVTIEELRALAAQGEIQKQTPVIEKGKKEWMRWRALEESFVNEKPSIEHEVHTPQSKPEPKADPVSLADRFAFIGKITCVYDKIDGLCEKLCQGKLVGDTEQYIKNLSLLNGLVGVGTLLCALCYCWAEDLFTNMASLLVVLLGGVVLQYISYQMYCAMLPLLFGSKIKLSSMWLPRIIAFACVPVVLAGVVGAIFWGGINMFLLMLGVIFTFVCMGYYCLNCKKLFVELSQSNVVPGREFLNLVRFLVRVVFITLHVLTPVYMLLASLILLFIDKKAALSYHSFGSFAADSVASSIALYAAVLPLILLPLFYIFSFIPDFLEAVFARNDNKE